MLVEGVNVESLPTQARRTHLMVLGRFLREPCVSMLLVAAAILFAGLGQGDIRIDGPIYAWAAKHMVVSGDWLNLYYDHGQTPYFNKPPLQFWLMALVFKGLGFSTFSAKLISVLFGVGCVAMVYALARLRFEPAVAATAGIVLATTYTFVRNTASVRLDAGVTFFFLVALYAGARMLLTREQKISTWAVLGAACGLALMIKSGAALLCLPILILTFAWNRRWDLLLNWRVAVAVAACASIVLPWYLHQYQTWGQTFIDQHFRNQMLGRFEPETFGTSAWYAYLQDLTTRYWPWFPLGVYGVYRLVRAGSHVGEREAGLDRMFIVWALGCLLALHLLPRKYDRYLLFVYPGLAMFVGYGVFCSPLWQHWKSRLLPHLGWAGILITIALHLCQVRFHSTRYPELAQALPEMNRAKNGVVYVLNSVPMNVQCNLRFFSDVKVKAIKASKAGRLEAGQMLVLPSKDGVPPGSHKVIAEGRHLVFVVIESDQ